MNAIPLDVEGIINGVGSLYRANLKRKRTGRLLSSMHRAGFSPDAGCIAYLPVRYETQFAPHPALRFSRFVTEAYMMRNPQLIAMEYAA